MEGLESMGLHDRVRIADDHFHRDPSSERRACHYSHRTPQAEDYAGFVARFGIPIDGVVHVCRKNSSMKPKSDMFSHVFYLPFYFQAVKGTDAQESGIRCIAYLISSTVASLIFGGIVTGVGYYTPFLYFGTARKSSRSNPSHTTNIAAVYTIGSGFIYTLKVDSSKATWIGYQVLAGFGTGCVQLPFIAVQSILPPKLMPTGNAIAIFSNTLGGAISISIAQNIFANTLVKEITKQVPDLDPYVVINAGAAHLRDEVTDAQLPGTLLAYNKALTTAFILPIAAGGIAFLSSLLFEWRSIKGKNLLAAGPA